MRKLIAYSLQLTVTKIRQTFFLQAAGSKLQAQKGFTLLLAALVASTVLALGAAIFSIAQKQVILSSIGRDSQFAFYVADTAAECALYWDFRFAYFGTTTPPGFDATTLKCDTECLAGSGTCTDVPGHASTYPYTMNSQQMNFFVNTTPGNFCAQVSVTKCDGPFDSSGICTSQGGAVRTLIHADGYNVPCAAVLTSPRALQRSVELHY